MEQGQRFWFDSRLDLGKGPSPRLWICSYCATISLRAVVGPLPYPGQNQVMISLQASHNLYFLTLYMSLELRWQGFLLWGTWKVPSWNLEGLWLTSELIYSLRLWHHSVTEWEPARHVHPLHLTSRCESQSAHAGIEAAGSLSLHTRSPGLHEQQPHTKAAGKVLSLISPICFFLSWRHSFWDSWVLGIIC